MSEKYDEYINEHKANVLKAFEWLDANIPEIFTNDEQRNVCRYMCEYQHDNSKKDPDEYNAYDAYFYGKNKSYEVCKDFDKAWLNHIHKNAHHWQHWILVSDDPQEPTKVLEMPMISIIEMICDWWSFSWAKSTNTKDVSDLNEIFDWYDEHKDHILLAPATRMTVEGILNKISMKINGKYRYSNKI